jgi:hypothetical protein
MHQTVEEAFDNGNIVIFQVNSIEKSLSRWKIVVINDNARNGSLKWGSPVKIGDLDGRELDFRSTQRLAARFLYPHFVISLLRYQNSALPGWESVCKQFRNTTLFPY